MALIFLVLFNPFSHGKQSKNTIFVILIISKTLNIITREPQAQSLSTYQPVKAMFALAVFEVPQVQSQKVFCEGNVYLLSQFLIYAVSR